MVKNEELSSPESESEVNRGVKTEPDIEIFESPPHPSTPPEAVEQKTPNKKRRKPKTEELEEITQCCMCICSFTSELDLRHHVETNHPHRESDRRDTRTVRVYECNFCRRKFWRQAHLLQHYKDLNYTEPPKPKRTVEKIICFICGMGFHCRRDLELHEATKHSTARDHVCDVNGCKAAFGHEIALKKHKTSVHGEKKHICDNCGKAFAKRNDMMQHTLSHLDASQKPWQCDRCDKAYTLESTLQAHILSQHSGIDYPHPCDLCEKAYKWRNELVAHRNAIHFGKYSHTCKHCNKGYTSFSSKKYHETRCGRN